MTARPADTQRQGVYDAEWAIQTVLDSETALVTVGGSTIARPSELKFADLASIQRYVDRVLALDWVQDTWAHARTPVTVRVRNGQLKAHYDPNRATIAVPMPRLGQGTRWACRESVLCHEIAHHLTRHYRPAHGPEFAAALTELVDGVMGPEAGLLYRVTFAETEVKLS